ncbi:cytochrome d ubiquinol oxidase subunit II [Oenococcus sicerae]|uniref:Cytochrome d ubiquinol oxidase subunit II n=1 Tax=Oenococcus sicerae TaxID=2203724 RepID=A0AAJ1RBL4_9LACO|nr:cytochrome d ubiquinol oxidase subunit II [Oenococcus sicerae]MDN6899787.1 cytochrome d ubiquinol oxidase subunit II [Oenococcus sicerae]QAS70475.1 cytochrome d ubiquinol oxidase subunit II [Oenococcus sicerae]
MTILQILWFVVIAVLFAGFLFFEGFDFGAGMATRLLANNDSERQTILRSIAPHWDGNEVWLITAGGAMFASFPLWYASLFSGYYILLFLTLIALIFRGVSFEFTAHAQNAFQRSLWLWTNFIGSVSAPFLLGMLLTSMMQGVPMDAQGNVWAGFFVVVNWLSVVGGLAVAYLSLIHGLHFISLKTKNSLHNRAINMADKLYWLVYPVLVIFALLAIFQTDFFTKHLMTSLFIVILLVLATLLGHLAIHYGHNAYAFSASGLSLILVIAFIFNGIFPRVMVSNNGKHDLLISTASASSLTLEIMTGVLAVLLPIVLIYSAWSYWIQRKKFVDIK